jgi:hypothetical protein
LHGHDQCTNKHQSALLAVWQLLFPLRVKRSTFCLLLLSPLAVSGDGNAVLWRDPGAVEKLDLAAGPLGLGGAPRPPFVFQQEDGGGSTPKILLQDAARRVWSVKWGREVYGEVFATRLLWGAGFMAEPSYFVRHGTIDSVGALSRASREIDRSQANAFRNARFELRPIDAFPAASAWNWNDNPFIGAPELQGLKIMVMLLSNWDAKDGRDNGPNTGILRVKREDGTEELQYLITDWGASMGKWGGLITREKWDCEGFTSQTAEFVKGVEKGRVRFGFSGVRQEEIAGAISAADVRWLMRYLGRIGVNQIQDALTASGATPAEVRCFSAAIRDRIEQLRRVAGPAAPAPNRVS